jgi:hypothetical protein
MEEKVSANLGIYLGILSPANGSLCLTRRYVEHSITPGKSYKGCYELTGGAVLKAKNPSYDHPYKELVRLVEKKIGPKILSGGPKTLSVFGLLPSYMMLLKKTDGTYDLAMVIPLEIPLHPWVGEQRWVSTAELNKLAREFVQADPKKEIEGKGLLSGYGKRMHCMSLAALTFSSNYNNVRLAKKTLAKIQKNW